MNETPIKFLVVTSAEDKLPCIEKAIQIAFGEKIQLIHKDSFQAGCEALLENSFDMVLADLELADNRGVAILQRFSLLSERAPIDDRLSFSAVGSLLSERAPLVAMGPTSEMRAASIRNSATDYINSAEYQLDEWVGVILAAWERSLLCERSRAHRIDSAVDRFEQVAKEWRVANG